MVDGDLDNYSTLASAFEGAHAIFSVTDFWQPFFDAVNQAKLRPGQSMNEFCYELELQRGKNIADAANKITTLERFVCSSLSHAKKWSKGKYTWVYHFDSKAAVVEYIREKHPALAQKMSVLQLGLYATHWKGPKWIAPQKVNHPHSTTLNTKKVPHPNLSGLISPINILLSKATILSSYP